VNAAIVVEALDMSAAPLTANLARRTVLVAGTALAAGCALPAPPASAPAAAAPVLRIGERWRYEKVNLYNGQRIALLSMQVVDIAPEVRVRVTDAEGRDGPEEVYAGPWRVVQEPAYDQVQIFRDPMPLLPERLVPGANERRQTVYHLAGSERELYWSEWLDVEGWERVRVPAGEFDALRIVRRIGFVHAEIWRQQSSRLDTLWYAPAVNRWVQRTWTGTYYWPGTRRAPLREDNVAWRLIDHTAVA
jgi:hypothetical protein